jgi:hypothetical protein
MKSKKGVLLRDFVFAGMYAMGIIAFFVIAVGAMAINYDRPDMIDSQFSDNYNKLNRMTDSIESTRQAVISPGGLSFIGTFSVAFNSIFTAVNLVLTSLDIFGTMSASAMSGYIPLDATVIKILLGIFLSAGLVVIIFVLLSSVTRGRI